MIYCVEDDPSIRDLLAYALHKEGYETRLFENGSTLMDAIEEKEPELILLDIMLPGENGISILKRLRASAATQDIPIIMASAKGTEYDKVIGLDLGADDYLAKPFGMMEMISRIRAVLRRASSGKAVKELRAGALIMDAGGHCVSINGERINLTLKEYELLQLFLENPGIVFTRDRLLESIWGMDYDGETRTVDVHIRTLRAKLGECGEYISTVRGVGYRLEAPND